MKTALFSLKLIAKITGFLIVLLLYAGCIEDEPATGSLGKLELNPGEMIVNTSTLVKLRIQAEPGIKISSETLKVIKIGKDGKESEIGSVADNGNLNEYGDDILLGKNNEHKDHLRFDTFLDTTKFEVIFNHHLRKTS